MASLLNISAPFSSELSLIIQLISLGLLIVGFIIIKQKKIRLHGVVMFIASLLNLISVLTVMVPVAFRLADLTIPGINILFSFHLLLGVAVIGMSGYILLEWSFQKPSSTCFQRTKWMLGLGLSWIAQVIIGMILFMRLYPT